MSHGQKRKNMLVTTTMDIEGYRVIDYCGMVRGLIVRSPTIMQGFMGSLKNIIGGKIGAFTQMCEQGRRQAYELMVTHATELGAHAIIGVRYDASSLAGERFAATEVLCYGTAVMIQRVE
jgi:uncharacterized protein YbjQ (UPF0145 family)